MKKTIIAIVSLAITVVILTGCSDRLETDPTVLLPIFLQAKNDCEGGYKGTDENILRKFTCEDYYQLSACLTGKKDECPPKDYGLF